MSRKTKLILTITITVLATLLLLWLLQMLLMPKYMTEIREGALISEILRRDQKARHHIRRRLRGL